MFCAAHMHVYICLKLIMNHVKSRKEKNYQCILPKNELQSVDIKTEKHVYTNLSQDDMQKCTSKKATLHWLMF